MTNTTSNQPKEEHIHHWSYTGSNPIPNTYQYFVCGCGMIKKVLLLVEPTNKGNTDA